MPFPAPTLAIDLERPFCDYQAVRLSEAAFRKQACFKFINLNGEPVQFRLGQSLILTDAVLFVNSTWNLINDEWSFTAANNIKPTVIISGYMRYIIIKSSDDYVARHERMGDINIAEARALLASHANWQPPVH